VEALPCAWGWSRFAYERAWPDGGCAGDHQAGGTVIDESADSHRRNWRVKLNLVPHVAALQAAVVIIALVLQAG
jgi:hypothetical protein